MSPAVSLSLSLFTSPADSVYCLHRTKAEKTEAEEEQRRRWADFRWSEEEEAQQRAGETAGAEFRQRAQARVGEEGPAGLGAGPRPAPSGDLVPEPEGSVEDQEARGGVRQVEVRPREHHPR